MLSQQLTKTQTNLFMLYDRHQQQKQYLFDNGHNLLLMSASQNLVQY